MNCRRLIRNITNGAPPIWSLHPLAAAGSHAMLTVTMTMTAAYMGDSGYWERIAFLWPGSASAG